MTESIKESIDRILPTLKHMSKKEAERGDEQTFCMVAVGDSGEGQTNFYCGNPMPCKDHPMSSMASQWRAEHPNWVKGHDASDWERRFDEEWSNPQGITVMEKPLKDFIRDTIAHERATVEREARQAGRKDVTDIISQATKGLVGVSSLNFSDWIARINEKIANLGITNL